MKLSSNMLKNIQKTMTKKLTLKDVAIVAGTGIGLLGTGLYIMSEKPTKETKRAFKKYNEDFPSDKRILPFTTDSQAVASYSKKIPHVIFTNPKNIKDEIEILKLKYPKIDSKKAEVGILKHELRHAEIDAALKGKRYTLGEREKLYDKTKCLQEVDAEKTMYHFMAKNDPSFKKHFPTVASMSGYADECHKEFAENEKLGNQPESAESVVKRIQALETQKGHPIQKP
jgi:hypothetical protein